jgi:hypothetical protein
MVRRSISDDAHLRAVSASGNAPLADTVHVCDALAMLRTADEILDALAAKKVELQLSNAMVDDLAGLTLGHFDKIAGPARDRLPKLPTLMAVIGALGLAVQLVEDPDTTVARRWQKRREDQARGNGRISKAAIKRVRPILMRELALKAVRARWSKSTPEQRAATVAALNVARAAKRRTRTNEVA